MSKADAAGRSGLRLRYLVATGLEGFDRFIRLCHANVARELRKQTSKIELSLKMCGLHCVLETVFLQYFFAIVSSIMWISHIRHMSYHGVTDLKSYKVQTSIKLGYRNIIFVSGFKSSCSCWPRTINIALQMIYQNKNKPLNSFIAARGQSYCAAVNLTEASFRSLK